MPMSKLIEELLRNKEQAHLVFEKEGFEKAFTPQNKDELIQEANNGNQWAQYYVGMSPPHIAFWASHH